MVDMFYFFMGVATLVENSTLPCMCVCFQNYSETYHIRCSPTTKSSQVDKYCRSTESSSAIYRPRRGRKGAPRLSEACSNKADEYKVVRTFEFLIAIVVGDQYVIDVY